MHGHLDCNISNTGINLVDLQNSIVNLVEVPIKALELNIRH